jgi:hypothetical protein
MHGICFVCDCAMPHLMFISEYCKVVVRPACNVRNQGGAAIALTYMTHGKYQDQFAIIITLIVKIAETVTVCSTYHGWQSDLLGGVREVACSRSHLVLNAQLQHISSDTTKGW